MNNMTVRAALNEIHSNIVNLSDEDKMMLKVELTQFLDYLNLQAPEPQVVKTTFKTEIETVRQII